MAARPTFPDLVRAAVAKGGTGDVIIERDMEVSEPVLFFDEAGIRIIGKNGRRPVLYWTGEANNMLDWANCRDTLIENVCVEIHGKLGSVAHYWRKVLGRTTPTNNKHRGVAVLVRPGGVLHRFASHDTDDASGSPIGIDENNEFSLYEDCDVNGAYCGVRFVGQQSHGHVLTRCRFGVKQYAVISSGWFSATDVSGSGLECAFRLNGISAPIHLVRPNFEAVQRLLIASGPINASDPIGFHGDSQAILIAGGSTRCDQLHTDGNLIELRSGGPMKIVGHQFGSGKQRVPHILTDHPGMVTVDNCDLGCWGSDNEPLVRRRDNSADQYSQVVNTVAHTSSGKVVVYPPF